MTTITRVAYAYVEHRGRHPQMQVRTVDADLRSYLAGHLDDLVARASGTRVPPARFVDQAAADRFAALGSGTPTAFTRASQELADRLVAEMDGRSGRGFLVTLQARTDDDETGAAALKLDVTGRTGAAMGPTDGGEPTLEVVRDMLVELGRLQKGCVVPDGRAGSDAVIGDRLTQTALYFLRAMGLLQQEAAGPGTLELVRVIGEVAPAAAGPAATALAGAERTTVDDFLDAHPGLLTDEQRDEVRRRTQERNRPIVDIDPVARAMVEVVEADGITVRGPVDTLAGRLRIEDRPGGSRIVIDVSEQPRRRYE